MKDIIQQAELDTPQTTIEALAPSSSSYMYLEKVVTGWVSGKAIQPPCLARFNPHTNFADWERGRLFCAEFELRWEKIGAKFNLVYVGQNTKLAGFSSSPIDLTLTEADDQKSYYLWGRRVAEGDLKKTGLLAEPKDVGLFIEMRVAQQLQYPIHQSKAYRVKLQVRHYCNPQTQQLVYHRYYGLEEEVEKHESL